MDDSDFSQQDFELTVCASLGAHQLGWWGARAKGCLAGRQGGLIRGVRCGVRSASGGDLHNARRNDIVATFGMPPPANPETDR